MTDARQTGEQPTVIVKNGNGMWKWAVGTLVGVGGIVIGGVMTIKTDIATMKADIAHISETINTERGMTERLDRENREQQKSIIQLEALAHPEEHNHRRR